jgi:sugar lactone lactonase YvrE
MELQTAAPFFIPPDEGLRHLPEGPRMLDARSWPVPGRWVAWVGIQHGAGSRVGSVNLLDLGTRTNTSYPLPGRPGFVAETDRPGILLVGLERELVLFDVNSAAPSIEHIGLTVVDDPKTIINDGIATPFGVIFGTKELNFRDPLAHLYLYRYGANKVEILRDGQTCSNGKVVLRRNDGLYLLDIDTPTRTVVRYAFDPEQGAVGPPSCFLDLTHRTDYPDGMCLTPDGRGIVIAFYNPGDVPYGVAQQFNLATGEAEAEWQTPGSPRVTCPCFVRMEDGIHLLLTTAVEGMASEQRARHAHAGTVFTAEAGSYDTLPPSFKVKL